MNLLKPIGAVEVAAVLVIAGQVAIVAAQSKGAGLAITPVSNAALTAPLRSSYGKVRSISGHVLSLESAGHDVTFIVDENTQVLARGAGRTARKAGGGVPITDLLRRGDVARVDYRELNGAMRAVEIQVTGRTTIASR